MIFRSGRVSIAGSLCAWDIQTKLIVPLVVLILREFAGLDRQPSVQVRKHVVHQRPFGISPRVLLLPEGVPVWLDQVPARINQAFKFVRTLCSLVPTVQAELLKLAFVGLSKFVDLLTGDGVDTLD